MTEVTPSPDGAPWDRHAAVRALLETDESLMGRVYRHLEAGRTPQEIMEAEGNQTVAFVYNYRLQIDALVDWEVPTSAWAARAVASKVRRWLKDGVEDAQLREELTKFEATARSRADDPEAEAAEVSKAARSPSRPRVQASQGSTSTRCPTT